MNHTRKPSIHVADRVRITELEPHWPEACINNLTGLEGEVVRVDGGPNDRAYLVNWGFAVMVNPISASYHAWFSRKELELIA
jgi:hypothetical protein